MKALTFVLSAIIAASLFSSSDADLMKDKLIRHTLECIPDFKLSQTDLEKILRTDFSDASEEQKCFIRCVFNRANFIKNGQLKKKAMRSILIQDQPVAYVDGVLDACEYQKGRDDCQAAFDLAECYNVNVKNLKAKLQGN